MDVFFDSTLMDAVLDQVIFILSYVFKERWIAPLLLAPAIIVIAVCIGVYACKRAKPVFVGIDKRIHVLSSTLSTFENPVDMREAFAHNFTEIDRVLSNNDKGTKKLVLAWLEFHESIIDETETPIRNTNRPSVYFSRAMPSVRELVFWSNIAVGVGLLLTFLGLIVALDSTRSGMMSGDSQLMQSSLTELLTVAGAKFFTSVAGIASSLVLKSFEHNLTKKAQRKLDDLCSLIECGLLYTPPQRIAVEQLKVLRTQADQMKSFNTDFALQLSERIGGQFQQAIMPVTASLGALNESIVTMSQGLGQGAERAIAEASGGELRVLGQTLATLGEKLNLLSTTVTSSGEDAARQIRLAGEDFATAAREIKEAFAQLGANVDTIGDKLRAQSDAGMEIHQQAVSRAAEGLDAAHKRSAEAMETAVDALRVAGQNAAVMMTEKVGDALATGVNESRAIFREALEETGGEMKDALVSFNTSVVDAVRRIEEAGAGFSKTGDAAERTAVAIDAVVLRAKGVEGSFERISTGVANVLQPMSQSLHSMNEAAGRIQVVLAENKDAEMKVLEAMQQLVSEVKNVQEAAADAWGNYSERFDGVDKALEGSVLKLGETLGDSMDRFRQFATELDLEMAKAVSQLNGPVSVIEDYAEALDEYVQERRKSRGSV